MCQNLYSTYTRASFEKKVQQLECQQKFQDEAHVVELEEMAKQQALDEDEDVHCQFEMMGDLGL